MRKKATSLKRYSVTSGPKLLAALWVKYALVPIEIAQWKLFKEIARAQSRAATEGKS